MHENKQWFSSFEINNWKKKKQKQKIDQERRVRMKIKAGKKERRECETLKEESKTAKGVLGSWEQNKD